MTPHLPGLLERMAGRRVLVVGDVILDEYIDGDAARISPEAPVPVLRFTSQRSVLGGAANTAANVASLGGHATLVGAIAADAAGAEVMRQCAAAGIHLAAIDDERPTIRKVRVISRQQQLLRIDYEESADIGARAQAQLVATVRERIAAADIVVVSDYAKGLLAADTFAAIRGLAAQAGKAVVVDPRPSHASFYEGCDYLTPNWKEALGLLREDDGAVAECRGGGSRRQPAARPLPGERPPHARLARHVVLPARRLGDGGRGGAGARSVRRQRRRGHRGRRVRAGDRGRRVGGRRRMAGQPRRGRRRRQARHGHGHAAELARSATAPLSGGRRLLGKATAHGCAASAWREPGAGNVLLLTRARCDIGLASAQPTS